MIGSFLTRALILALGYAYPAYNCYKTVELNRPDIEKLRFWSKYWILVALLTVVERFSDYIISWLPMYGEAKLAFFVYLWYSKTNGTPYVYDTFLRPLVSRHERDIDRNLVELRTRATDVAADYWSKALVSAQTMIIEAIRYVTTHPLASRTPPVKENVTRQTKEKKATPPVERSLEMEKVRVNAPSDKPLSPADTSELDASSSDESKSTEVESTGAMEKEDAAEESVMEDAIRLTRARLRKRMGSTGTGTDSGPNTPK